MHQRRIWEYKVITLDELTQNEELTGLLDGFGAEGWELVATTAVGQVGCQVDYVFKRPVLPADAG